MKIRNTSSTARVVTVSPVYELEDGEHGASLNDEAERKIRAYSTVSIKADAGLPHRDGGSEIIKGQPTIKDCRPLVDG